MVSRVHRDNRHAYQNPWSMAGATTRIKQHTGCICAIVPCLGPRYSGADSTRLDVHGFCPSGSSATASKGKLSTESRLKAEGLLVLRSWGKLTTMMTSWLEAWVEADNVLGDIPYKALLYQAMSSDGGEPRGGVPAGYEEPKLQEDEELLDGHIQSAYNSLHATNKGECRTQPTTGGTSSKWKARHTSSLSPLCAPIWRCSVTCQRR